MREFKIKNIAIAMRVKEEELRQFLERYGMRFGETIFKTDIITILGKEQSVSKISDKILFERLRWYFELNSDVNSSKKSGRCCG